MTTLRVVSKFLGEGGNNNPTGCKQVLGRGDTIIIWDCTHIFKYKRDDTRGEKNERNYHR